VKLVAQVRQKLAAIKTPVKVAVMGCVVNGPGESRHADIGLSLPGNGEEPRAPVYIDGRLEVTLKGETIAEDFGKLLDAYVVRRWGSQTAKV